MQSLAAIVNGGNASHRVLVLQHPPVRQHLCVCVCLWCVCVCVCVCGVCVCVCVCTYTRTRPHTHRQKRGLLILEVGWRVVGVEGRGGREKDRVAGDDTYMRVREYTHRRMTSQPQTMSLSARTHAHTHTHTHTQTHMTLTRRKSDGSPVSCCIFSLIFEIVSDMRTGVVKLVT